MIDPDDTLPPQAPSTIPSPPLDLPVDWDSFHSEELDEVNT